MDNNISSADPLIQNWVTLSYFEVQGQNIFSKYAIAYGIIIFCGTDKGKAQRPLRPYSPLSSLMATQIFPEYYFRASKNGLFT